MRWRLILPWADRTKSKRPTRCKRLDGIVASHAVANCRHLLPSCTCYQIIHVSDTPHPQEGLGPAPPPFFLPDGPCRSGIGHRAFLCRAINPSGWDRIDANESLPACCSVITLSAAGTRSTSEFPILTSCLWRPRSGKAWLNFEFQYHHLGGRQHCDVLFSFLFVKNSLTFAYMRSRQFIIHS